MSRRRETREGRSDNDGRTASTGSDIKGQVTQVIGPVVDVDKFPARARVAAHPQRAERDQPLQSMVRRENLVLEVDPAPR